MAISSLVSPPNPSLWYVDPKTANLVYKLHYGQAKAWRSKRRFVFVVSGTQGGKTSFGPLWLHREIARKGPGDYLAVTSTFSLLKLKMLPEFRRFFERTLHFGTWHPSDRYFEVHPTVAAARFDNAAFLREPTRILFGSAHNPEMLESATAKAAWLDECGQDDFRIESWEAVQRRLSLAEGRVLGTTTPYNFGWLKREVYDRFYNGDPTFDVIQFASIDNPIFPRAEFERARIILPTWKFDMFYRGRFARPAGMIYADFLDTYREEGGHVVHPFTIPPEWPRYVGADFGGANTATVWIAKDPLANVFYLYHESLEGGLTTKEHCERARAQALGTNVVTWAGGAKSETQQRADWAANGVPLQEPLVVDVEAGIDRVTALLKTHRLYVFDTCRGMLDELGTYARILNELNQPTEKIKDKERYHRLDASRYIVQYLALPPATEAVLDRTAPYDRPRLTLFRGRS